MHPARPPGLPEVALPSRGLLLLWELTLIPRLGALLLLLFGSSSYSESSLCVSLAILRRGLAPGELTWWAKLLQTPALATPLAAVVQGLCPEDAPAPQATTSGLPAEGELSEPMAMAPGWPPAPKALLLINEDPVIPLGQACVAGLPGGSGPWGPICVVVPLGTAGLMV